MKLLSGIQTIQKGLPYHGLHTLRIVSDIDFSVAYIKLQAALVGSNYVLA